MCLFVYYYYYYFIIIIIIFIIIIINFLYIKIVSSLNVVFYFKLVLQNMFTSENIRFLQLFTVIMTFMANMTHEKLVCR